ncbi:hypothetical protein GGR53DRAFT_465561 [Hypoxylon sp. FL1150]|nr:hypothetical protein GGR53DRAFT_465561 [Hypoxylon sp. FL1150]
MVWLTRADTDDTYTNAVFKHTSNPESCRWFYQTHEYQQWAKDNALTNSLWVHSSPGTGNSVLMGHVIRTLKDEYEYMNSPRPQATLGFSFCNGASAKDDLLAAIRTILCQFLDYLPTLPKEVELEFQES